MEAIDRVREAVARWRHSMAQRAVHRARKAEPVGVTWPRDPERLGEVAGDMLPLEASATAAHFARARADRELEPARDAAARQRAAMVTVERDRLPLREALHELWRAEGGRGDALLRTIEDASRSLLPEVLRARNASERHAAQMWVELGQEPHADAGPDREARRAMAEQWLSATDAIRDDVVNADTLPELMRALRWREGDGAFAPRDRYRRAGTRWAPLGFEGELARAVRVEPLHRQGHPETRVWVLGPGTDVRLVPSSLELGWQSEVAAARGVGRALARAMVGPLPTGLRFASVASVPRAMGELGVQVLAEPAWLLREGLANREAEAMRRRVGVRALLETRWACAAALVRSALHEDDLETLCVEAAQRALGVAVPPAMAMLALRGGGGVRLRASLAGLRLWAGLREGWDEDWYRNPRAAEPIRSACERGGTLSVEAWCDELDAPPALPRLLELF